MCVAAADMQLLVGIMDDVQRQYMNSVAEDGRLWLEGQIAVSQFTDDGLFYRARVLNVIDADTVEVSFVILSQSYCMQDIIICTLTLRVIVGD